MTSTLELTLQDESQTLALGQRLASLLRGGGVLYLQGDLGAGKTTLSRGIIQALGHSGAVKSPTYTLVEPYELADLKVFHFDLYRLADPEELEFIGIRDYVEPGAVCIVEWPDRGADLIPSPDLSLTLEKDGKGRKITMMGRSPAGQTMLGGLTKI
ncbi:MULTISPECIES: tRNA (adenosine(37)-N6)-threonylcarbamoyltransferase complex ATPase subunit type 1 TsaE [unclassified Ketobacter]|uniref:tRNA (adenosine(37)-N6)-threonylcarbamoyltransferase complex ATPase subunit type 1 TsaE n=1 Tax=unclassified Ketobacter TaxID=2639109 RepID=UPI000F2671A8|nr:MULTISPECIES: tRNA (adenosine(37)-N6)-threonylcarbamoyltransferase complex ATPase subunit type 1 TsaE [unclassified Ketobacter]RLT87922.1 MAG: tRNA (adenosine(37)-N6)-threonylcarbamoyltransferase complex ATPase subunit type 1 TsaE [Ketobacter sp. GenoA1]RLT96713.1 MAG: tRNA (adenosine(37)-N6)-threonylcarbamoyltransferase complex ATPase subunit type 1 TsaE [Ketobacter sp.]